jgi:hypothetical protein
MARQNTIFQNPKSIAGTVLIGLGILILSANLARAASQLSHLLGMAAENADTPSVLTTVGLLAGHAVQAYLFDHTEFLRGFHQILISFSALLLIVAGMLFLHLGSRWEGKDLREKRAVCRFRCLSFDA